MALSLALSVTVTLAHSDSLWLTLALSLALPGAHRLTRSLLGSLRLRCIAPVHPALFHRLHCLVLMPLILSNYTALAACTANSVIPFILLRLLGHRRCWTKQKQAPSPLTHIQMTKHRFKVFPHRLLRRKRSMQAMIYNSKEADLLLLMSSHMGQMGPL